MANGYTVVQSNDTVLSIQQWLQEQIDRLRGFAKPFGYIKPPDLTNPTITPKPTLMGLQVKTQQYVNDMPSGVEN